MKKHTRIKQMVNLIHASISRDTKKLSWLKYCILSLCVLFLTLQRLYTWRVMFCFLNSLQLHTVCLLQIKMSCTVIQLRVFVVQLYTVRIKELPNIHLQLSVKFMKSFLGYKYQYTNHLVFKLLPIFKTEQAKLQVIHVPEVVSSC